MLENKLGLTSSAELAREEERISKKKAAMLFENHILVNLAPVDNLADFCFQHMVKPDSCTATVALSERVCNVHFDILFYNLIKIALWHFINIFQS